MSRLAKLTTKERILDRAFEVLLEKGFVGFTMQSVAEAAEISLGNLTYHYATREVLVESMLDRWYAQWSADFAQLIAKGVNERSVDIDQFIDWVMEDALRKENVRIFTELWAFGGRAPKVARLLDQLYEQAIETVVLALGIGPQSKKAGELRSLLYVLAALSEGATAVLGNTRINDARRKDIVRQARAILGPVFKKALAPI